MNIIKRLLPKKFVLMLSGGEDSIAAAHFLGKNPKNDFICWHFHNKFIPQDSLAHDNVKNFCEDNKIELKVFYNSEDYDGGSVEAWARKVRYSHLEKFCAGYKLDKVISIHHLNDCVESYLMNCFKGQAEYCPIPPVTKFENFTIYRPFLLTLKEEFSKYVDSNNLRKCVIEDECNENLKFRRNLIRKVLLPIMNENNIHLNKVVKKKMEGFISNIGT